jgi:hypothetical protein
VTARGFPWSVEARAAGDDHFALVFDRDDSDGQSAGGSETPCAVPALGRVPQRIAYASIAHPDRPLLVMPPPPKPRTSESLRF